VLALLHLRPALSSPTSFNSPARGYHHHQRYHPSYGGRSWWDQPSGTGLEGRRWKSHGAIDALAAEEAERGRRRWREQHWERPWRDEWTSSAAYWDEDPWPPPRPVSSLEAGDRRRPHRRPRGRWDDPYAAEAGAAAWAEEGEREERDGGKEGEGGPYLERGEVKIKQLTASGPFCRPEKERKGRGNETFREEGGRSRLGGALPYCGATRRTNRRRRDARPRHGDARRKKGKGGGREEREGGLRKGKELKFLQRKELASTRPRGLNEPNRPQPCNTCKFIPSGSDLVRGLEVPSPL